MKYRLPQGCAGVSHAGKPLTIGSDGTLDLDAATAADLLPHGIEPAAKPPAGPADGKTPGAPDKRMLR